MKITDFNLLGPEHIISILIAVLTGLGFIIWGLKDKSEKGQRNIRITLVIVIVFIRAVRYFMDVYFGVFNWTDLLSLQICNIDLYLLIICLIKPGKPLFNFCFIIGIPMALAVAFFPGTIHPAPGLPRAMFFIMSHVMLVMGVLYLAIVLRLRPGIKYYFTFAIAGNIGLAVMYFVNLNLNTNYLYIMSAPAGTVISPMSDAFGWPGYVFVMDALALFLMFVVFCLGQMLAKKVELSRNLNYNGN